MSCKVYDGYRRITKPIARKMYNEGYDIKLLPCNVSDTFMSGNHKHSFLWVIPSAINIKDCDYDVNKFDRTVTDYEYYNCNAELGYYAHYFVTTDDYFKYKNEVKNNAHQS